MNHLTLVKYLSLLAGIIFLGMTVVLAVAVTMVESIVDELKQASNYSIVLLIITCVVSVVVSVIFFFSSLMKFRRESGGRNNLHSWTDKCRRTQRRWLL